MKPSDERRLAIATRYATWVVGLYADDLTERALARGGKAVHPRELLPMHEAIRERTLRLLALYEAELDPERTPIIDALEHEPGERPTVRPAGAYPAPDGTFEPPTKRSRRPPPK